MSRPLFFSFVSIFANDNTGLVKMRFFLGGGVVVDDFVVGVFLNCFLQFRFPPLVAERVEQHSEEKGKKNIFFSLETQKKENNLAV